MIGLGTGTLAAYGAKGDVYRFYDINPAVIDDREARLHLSRRQRRDDRDAARRRAARARARGAAGLRRARDRRVLERLDPGAPDHVRGARDLPAPHEADGDHRVPRDQPLPQPRAGRRGARARARPGRRVDLRRRRRQGWRAAATGCCSRRIEAVLSKPELTEVAPPIDVRRTGGCGPTTSTIWSRCSSSSAGRGDRRFRGRKGLARDAGRRRSASAACRGDRIVRCDTTQPPRAPRLDPAPYRALRRPTGARHVEAIDQRALPHAVVTVRIADADVAALAIRPMWVRGAPLIGAVGAYGLAMALDRDASDAALAPRARRARLDATDRGEPALGARSRAPPVAPLAADRSRRRRVARGRRDRGRGRRDQPRDRRARPAHPATHIAARNAGPVERDDPLQRGRARDLRLGHGHGARVPRARRGASRCTCGSSETRPRLQGANLTAWELRAARHSVHALRRRRGAALMRTRRRRRRVRRRRSRRARTATCATRSAPTTRRSRRTTTACRSTSRCPRRRSTPALADGDAIPIETRAPTRCSRCSAATSTARRSASASRPSTRARSTPRST